MICPSNEAASYLCVGGALLTKLWRDGSLLTNTSFIVVMNSALFDRKFKDLILLHVADCIRVQQYMLSNSLTTPVYICFGLFANPQSELLG